MYEASLGERYMCPKIEKDKKPKLQIILIQKKTCVSSYVRRILEN